MLNIPHEDTVKLIYAGLLRSARYVRAKVEDKEDLYQHAWEFILERESRFDSSKGTATAFIWRYAFYSVSEYYRRKRMRWVPINEQHFTRVPRQKHLFNLIGRIESASIIPSTKKVLLEWVGGKRAVEIARERRITVKRVKAIVYSVLDNNELTFNELEELIHGNEGENGNE